MSDTERKLTTNIRASNALTDVDCEDMSLFRSRSDDEDGFYYQYKDSDENKDLETKTDISTLGLFGFVTSLSSLIEQRGRPTRPKHLDIGRNKKASW